MPTSSLSSFGISFQEGCLIRNIWGFRAIIPNHLVKVLPCFSIGWCILFSGNTISKSSERSQISKYLLGPQVAHTTGGTFVMWRKQYQPMSNNRACKAKDESNFFCFLFSWEKARWLFPKASNQLQHTQPQCLSNSFS